MSKLCLTVTRLLLAGGTDSISGELDGGSFVSLFTNPQSGAVKRPVDGMIFSLLRRGQAVIRQGDFKLLCSVNNGKLPPGRDNCSTFKKT